jgi:hypothetical protein
MANEANLKPFKKGRSGNPKGRPKKLPELDKLLADVLGDEKDGVSAAEAILRAIRAKATRGDVRAAEVLLDRAWGKVKSHVDITSDDKPLIPSRVEWVVVDPKPPE